MRRYLLIFLALVNYSCTNNKEDQNFSNPILINQHLPSEDSKIDFLDFLEIQEIIPLQTSDSSLIDFVNKVIIDKDLIFIKGSKSVYKFQRDGTFLNKLAKKGKGPGEYTNLTDVILFPEEEMVWIYDSNRRSILKYTYDFEFETNTTVNHPILGIDYYDKTLVGSSGYYSDFKDHNSISFFNEFTFGIENSPALALPYNPEKSNYLLVHRHDYFSKLSNGLNFVNSFNDTIYRIEAGNSIYPEFYVDFGERKVSEDDLVGQGYKTIVDVYQHLNAKEKSFNISNTIQFENSLIYRFFNSGRSFLTVYNKNSASSTSGRSIKFLYQDREINIRLDEDVTFGSLGDGTGYFVIHPETLNSTLEKELFNIKDGDNPMLVIFKEK